MINEHPHTMGFESTPYDAFFEFFLNWKLIDRQRQPPSMGFEPTMRDDCFLLNLAMVVYDFSKTGA